MTAAAFVLASGAPTVSAGVTALFALLLVALIVCLALEEKLHAQKSVIAGAFAVVALSMAAATGIEPVGPLTNVFGHEIAMPVYVPSVDWSVIAIILGSSLFVDVTARSGLFTWIALVLTRASGGDLRRLLWAYGLMTVGFSAVLNNVTAMIIVGSLTAVSLERLGAKDKLLGFLLVEGLLTNVGGLLTLISSVPNILVGTAAGISFARFFVVASPYVVVATVVTLLLGANRFGIAGLPESQREAARARVAAFDPDGSVQRWDFFYVSAAMTVLFIGFIAFASVLPGIADLGMGFVAMAFGVAMLLRFKSEASTFYKAVDWDLLGFFAALFVVIGVMEHAGVLHALGGVLAWLIGLGEQTGAGLLLASTAGFSSVTDNIPLAAMLSKILTGLQTPGDSRLWWSVVFGANLGGNITPIGSASTLVAVTIIHKQGLSMSFARFVTLAAPFAAVQLALAALYVLLVL